jgi:sterol 3beta-glucosyltransferase
MKISIISLGSRGDVQPYAALGVAMQARGHQVTLATHGNFKTFVEGLGLGFVALPGDSKAIIHDPAISRLVAAGKVYEFFAALKHRFAPDKLALEDAARVSAEGADIVIGTAVTDYLAQAVAEAVGAKFVWSDLAPLTPTSAYPAFVFANGRFNLGPFNRLTHQVAAWGWWQLQRKDINQLRRRWSLPQSFRSPLSRARAQGLLQLHGYSPSLVPRPSDWGPEHILAGSWALPSEAAQALPGDHHDAGFAHWLGDGPAPVFFGFGSMAVLSGPEMLEIVGDVCEDLEIRGVIGAGWMDLSGPDCDLPEGVAIAEACDYAWLFPQCSVVMHHGGSGTTHTASQAGAPQVVCSLFADQPYWAGRVLKAGAGVHLPFKQLSVDRLREAVLQALAEDKADAAAALAQAMQAEDGLGAACEALEALATKP